MVKIITWLLTVKTVKINILDKYVLLCVEGY